MQSSQAKKRTHLQMQEGIKKKIISKESSYTKLQPTRVIGSGSFGYVFEAFDKETKKKVAVKRT